MTILEKINRFFSGLIYLKYRYPIKGRYYEGLDKIVTTLLSNKPNIIFGNVNDYITLLFGKYELSFNIKNEIYTIYEVDNVAKTLACWESSKGYLVEYTSNDHKCFRDERPSLYNLNRIAKLLNDYYKKINKQMAELEKESEKDRVLADEMFARNLYN